MKKLAWLILPTLLLSTVPVRAGKHDPDKLLSYEFEIEKLTLQEVNKRVKPEDIAAKYKLRTPIVPPRLDKSQVEALIAKEVEAAVELRHPHSHFQQIEVDAKERFRMYKVGEKVLLRVRDQRRSVWTKTYETIRQITPKGVRMGDQFFIFRDIHSAEYPHFFREQHDKAIEREIAANTARYKRVRAEYEKQAFRRLSRRIWRSEGYVYRRSNRKWVPREEVFNFLYQRAWKKAYDEVRSDIENTVKTNAGLAWNEHLGRWEDPTQEEPAVDDKTAKGTEKTGDAGKTTDAKRDPEAMEEWKSKIENLWKTKDKGEEDIWDEEDDGDKDGASDKKKPAAGDAKTKKADKEDSELRKKQKDLFGDD